MCLSLNMNIFSGYGLDSGYKGDEKKIIKNYFCYCFLKLFSMYPFSEIANEYIVK